MVQAHQLGNHRQAGGFLRFQQQLQPLPLQPLEGVRGRARLERPAPQQGSPAFLDIPRHRNHLLLALHRAGAGNNAEESAADAGLPRRHHRVLGMELAVGRLVRLRYPLDVLHNVVGPHGVHVHLRGVSDDAHNGHLGAGAAMAGQTHGLDAANQLLYPLPFSLRLQYDNHTNAFLSIIKNTGRLGYPQGGRLPLLSGKRYGRQMEQHKGSALCI